MFRCAIRSGRWSLPLPAIITWTGCYGGPCADPTTMILVNFVLPALLIGGIVYYHLAKD